MSKLTAIQQKFISELFGASLGNVKATSEKVLGTQDYSSIMTDELLAEIKLRSEAEIVMQAPKAVYTLAKMLDDPENAFFIEKLSKLCGDLLDRAGITKKEPVNTSMIKVGIVMLPSKAILPEPPLLENQIKIEGPILLNTPVIINDIQTKS